jgi:hypothetical protein
MLYRKEHHLGYEMCSGSHATEVDVMLAEPGSRKIENAICFADFPSASQSDRSQYRNVCELVGRIHRLHPHLVSPCHMHETVEDLHHDWSASG